MLLSSIFSLLIYFYIKKIEKEFLNIKEEKLKVHNVKNQTINLDKSQEKSDKDILPSLLSSESYYNFFPIKLLTLFSIQNSVSELINTILYEFCREFDFKDGTVYIFEFGKERLKFSKNLKGKFEKRPNYPVLLEKYRISLPLDITILNDDNGSNYIYIPLSIFKLKLGFLMMQCDEKYNIENSLSISSDIASLYLFYILLKNHFINIFDNKFEEEFILKTFIRKSIILTGEITSSSFSVFSLKVDDKNFFELSSTEKEFSDFKLLEKLIENMLIKNKKYFDSRELYIPNETIDIKGNSYYSINSLLDENGSFFSILNWERKYSYQEVHFFKLLNDLIINSMEEIEKLKILSEYNKKRLLTDSINNFFKEFIMDSESSKPIEKILCELNKYYDSDYLSIVSISDDNIIISSCGEKNKINLLKTMEEMNILFLFKNIEKTENLRELNYLNEKINNFIEKLGFSNSEAYSIYVYPVFQNNQFKNFLLIITKNQLPPFLLNKVPNDGFENIILSFISTLTLSHRDRMEKNSLKKEMEKMERLAAIGRVASGVAHEIRNPLGGIELYISTLKNLLKDEKYLKWVDSINDAVKKLNRIVSDLLLFAKDEYIELKEVVVISLINDILNSVEKERKEKSITIAHNVVPDIKVIGDPIRLNQVLLNILKNSVEAIEMNGKINIECDKISDDEVELIIEDDGPGIDDEFLNKIYDPFFTTKKNGTGLGLSISLKLIEKMNGKLKYERSSLGGAKFSIILKNGNIGSGGKVG